jgi:hypothetical protein
LIRRRLCRANQVLLQTDQECRMPLFIEKQVIRQLTKKCFVGSGIRLLLENIAADTREGRNDNLQKLSSMANDSFGRVDAFRESAKMNNRMKILNGFVI